MPYGIFFQKFTVGQPGMTGFGASIQPSGTAFGNQPSGTTFGNQPSITTGFSAMKPTLGMISSIYMYIYFFIFYIICFLINLEDKAMRNWICVYIYIY
jgi:hypothetical protein